jgi:hypothetical protein
LAQAGDFAVSRPPALTPTLSEIIGIFTGPLTGRKRFTNQILTLTEYFFPTASASQTGG